MNANKEFSAAFNGESLDDAPMVKASADEGVTDENKNDALPADASAEGAAETPAVAVVIGGEGEGEGDPLAAEAAAEGEPLAEESAEMASPEGDMDDGEIPPEEMHRQKSWEGRLKKREADLAARESSAGTPDDAEIAAARQQLVDDFGEGFVKLITLVAGAEARKNAGTADLSGVTGQIEQVIKDFQGALQSQHIASIADAHDDFLDIIGGQEFGRWIETLEPEYQEQAQMVIERGSAGSCIKLLNLFKESLKEPEAAADEGVTDAEDAATGVRGSARLSLPTAAPSSSDDEYKRAWESM